MMSLAQHPSMGRPKPWGPRLALVALALACTGCPKRAPEAPDQGHLAPPSGPAARGALATHALSRLVWPGGARLRGQAYQAGQRTHWQSSGNWAWPERYALTYLGREAGGDAWWRLAMSRVGAPDLILEAQVAPGAATIKGMREKASNGPVERLPLPAAGVPMGPWASNGLGGMSLEDRGNESVTGPGGTFLARHWRLLGPEGAKAEVWLIDGVPGGVVRAKWRTLTGELGALDYVRHDLDPEARWAALPGQNLEALLP